MGRPARHGHRGMKPTPEYTAWVNMKDRCFNPNGCEYHRYGARGITVCDRWKDSFDNFIADMGPKPGRNYSLDREDPEGDYTPANCRWTTSKIQANNKRNNVVIDGLTLAQLAEKHGIEYHTLWRRYIVYGWRGEKLFIPSTFNRKKNTS